MHYVPWGVIWNSNFIQYVRHKIQNFLNDSLQYKRCYYLKLNFIGKSADRSIYWSKVTVRLLYNSRLFLYSLPPVVHSPNLVLLHRDRITIELISTFLTKCWVSPYSFVTNKYKLRHTCDNKNLILDAIWEMKASSPFIVRVFRTYCLYFLWMANWNYFELFHLECGSLT